MADNELGDEVKRAIVTANASWESPSDVVALIKADFGVTVSRQQVETYDPTKVNGRKLSAGLKALFEEARKAWLAEEAEIGIAHKAFRLRFLQRMALKAESVGNIMGAAALLEQAAKEQGNAFSNRREISGPNGKPIETADTTPRPSAGAVRADLAAIFGAAAVAAGEAAADAPRGDPPVRKGARSRGAKKRRAPAAGKAVARKK